MLLGFALGAALCCAAVLSARTAHAQALDIDHPEITRGEREVRSINVVNDPFSSVPAGASRSSHELGAYYSPADWLKLGVHADIENVSGENWLVDHVAIESQFELLTAGEAGGLALGWSTFVQFSTDAASTNSLIFGPIVKYSWKDATVTANAYFEDTFGRNDTPGLALLYGWQARRQLREGLAIGIEGFGEIENLGDAPPVSEQDHRIGPGVFLSSKIAENHTLLLDVGVLFGLTESSPGTSLKVNFGATF